MKKVLIIYGYRIVRVYATTTQVRIDLRNHRDFCVTFWRNREWFKRYYRSYYVKFIGNF